MMASIYNNSSTDGTDPPIVYIDDYVIVYAQPIDTPVFLLSPKPINQQRGPIIKRGKGKIKKY